MSRAAQRLGINLLLATMSLGVSLGAAEWAARRFDLSKTWASYVDSPVFVSPDMVTPDVIGYRRLPHGTWAGPFGPTIETNREGFRDAEPPDSSTTGTLRILYIGDSVTEGYGVETAERYAELHAAEVARALGRAVRPIVMAIAGQSTVDEMAILSGYGLRTGPDLVVLQAGWGDVFENGSRRTEFTAHRWSEPRAPGAERSARPDDAGGLKNYLRAHSALYLMLAEARNTVRLRRGASSGELDRIAALAPADLAFSAAVLAELADTLAAHRIPLLVAYFPVESEVLSPDTTAGAAGRRWLSAAVGGRPGVALADLRAALRPGEGEGPPFLDNVHPTVEGHARAAAGLVGAALGLIRSQGPPYL